MSSDIPAARRLPELALQDHFVDRNAERAVVPCGSCVLCCRTLIVPLAEEEFENYQWAWVRRKDTGELLGRALQRRPNGDCVYLGESGCTIHERAPHACQRFDCRDLITKMDRPNRRAALKSGMLPQSLFDQGRKMQKSMSK